MKSKYIWEMTKASFDSKLLRTFFLLMLFALFYFNIQVYEQAGSYWLTIILCLKNQTILSVIVLPFFLFFNLNLLKTYEENSELIIRFKSKNQYLKNIIKTIVVSNTILFIFFAMIVITMINFTGNTNFRVDYLSSYFMNSVFYLLFLLVKYYVLIVLISIITVLLVRRFSPNVVVIGYFLFCASFWGYSNLFSSGIGTGFPLYIGEYFLDTVNYAGSFHMFLGFGIQVILLLGIILLIYHVTKRMEVMK